MRYVCEVLEEIRNCYKTYNFSPVLGLVEEVQSMVNRMEGALGEKKDYFYWKDEHTVAKQRGEKLRKKIKKIEDRISELEEQKDEKEVDNG